MVRVPMALVSSLAAFVPSCTARSRVVASAMSVCSATIMAATLLPPVLRSPSSRTAMGHMAVNDSAGSSALSIR